MKFASESTDNNETAFVFTAADEKTVIGFTVNVMGKITSQILNPVKHPPTAIEKSLSSHRVLEVEDKKYAAVTLTPSLTIEKYLKTANMTLCCEDMLSYLRVRMLRTHRTQGGPSIN